MINYYSTLLTLSGWESSWKSLVSLKTSMGGAICTGENNDDDILRIYKLKLGNVLELQANVHY